MRRTATAEGGAATSPEAVTPGPIFRKGVPVSGKLSQLPLKDKLIICFVFSVTGSSAVLVVRPALRYLVDNGFMGLPEDSGFIKGPWLYRFLYFAIMWPSYSVLLLLFGSIFGRRLWFSHMIIKMWGRVLPKGLTARLRYVLDCEVHPPKRSVRN
jgi:hypothetical protein